MIVQMEILMIIVIFLKYIKSNIVKNFVYFSFILSIIPKIINNCSNKIFVGAYILFFIATIIVLSIALKEKIFCQSDEAYKPLKVIAIILALINLIMSTIYLKYDFNVSFLNLIGCFMLITICYTNKKQRKNI